MTYDSATIFAVIFSLYIISLIVHRLFFHPLTKYPGPRLAGATNWYVAYYAWRGDMHVKTWEWHEQYGDIIRTGPNTLSLNSHNALKAVYGLNANVTKAKGYQAFSASRRSPNTISAVDRDVHRFKRRILNQVFSDQGLKIVEDRFLRNICDFIKILGDNENKHPDEDGWGLTKNMNSICVHLAFDIISDLCYGDDFDMLHSPDLRWFASAMHIISKRNAMCMTQPKVFNWKLDRIFLAPQYKKMLATGTWIKKSSEARMKLGNDIEQKDAFYSMMNARDPITGMSFTAKDLWLESMLLLVAGSDTTSTTMSATLFYLAHHPAKLARLTQEIRQCFKTSEDIRQGPNLASCKYLQACINEALRLAPSIPNMPPREVKAGGLIVDDLFIPAGTVIGTSSFSIHRNPDYFTAPTAFCPERWTIDLAAGVTDESVKLAKSAFCPFGRGPRSCVGWKLAWLEVNVTIARILWQYDMRLAPESPCCHGKRSDCEYKMKGWMTAVVEGPLLQFRAH